MKAEAYLKHWALANFLFHITMAYAILRHNGVELGKADYLVGAGALSPALAGAAAAVSSAASRSSSAHTSAMRPEMTMRPALAGACERLRHAHHPQGPATARLAAGRGPRRVRHARTDCARRAARGRARREAFRASQLRPSSPISCCSGATSAPTANKVIPM